VKTLETRLLIHAEQVHTQTGAHSKNLEAWSVLAARLGLAAPFPDVTTARQQLDATLAALNQRHAARATLPWSTAQPGRGDRLGTAVRQ
jgi:hypothetical protein